jgi:hypothetical protein
MSDHRKKAARFRTPVVAMKRLRCERCRSIDVRTTRTLESTAELLVQRKSCRTCGHCFLAIFD